MPQNTMFLYAVKRFFFSSCVFFCCAGFQPLAFSQSDMEPVLRRMDEAAAKFKTTQADFEWTLFNKLTGDSDKQEGKIYFRRKEGHVQMAADIVQPKPPKYVLFMGDQVQLYETGINRVTNYNSSKNRAEFETFLVLGFGGGGHDLEKSFDVTYKGKEKLGDSETDVLDLVPKSEKIRNTFPHIVLWIDPGRGISVQQKLMEPSGDYRLQKYSNIEINENVPDSAFKLKTNGKTETINQGGGL